MSDFFYSQLENLDGDSLSAIIASAVAVCAADGAMESNEMEQIANSLTELTGGGYSYEDIYGWISAGIDEIINNGADETLERAAVIEDPTLREVALMLASAVAWCGKGVNTAEGLRLQKLSHVLGIGQNRYFECLAEGKKLVNVLVD